MIDDLETTVKIQSIHTHGNHLSPLQWACNHSVGQYRNSQTVDHCVDQSSGAGCFPGRRYRESGAVNHPVKHLPCSTSGFPQKKFLCPEFFNSQLLPLPKMSIAEMTPGPIAINSATFVGIQVAGLPGAIVATLGCVVPSCIIVLTLAYVYYRFRGLSIVQGILAGFRPAVVAMIASAGLSLLIMALYGERSIPTDVFSFDLIALVMFSAGFFVLRKWKLSPLWVMAGCGAAGVILYSIV